MVFIRADSNQFIAGGHISRCIAIASELKEQGEAVCFLVADDNPVPALSKAGFPFINLHSEWNDLMSDVTYVKSVLKKERTPVLLIDTYQISRRYVEELKSCCRIAYLGSKDEYLGPLDWLINYSTDIDYDFYNTSYDEQTELLLGPAYAPIKKEFRNYLSIQKEKLGNILITTGNTNKNCIMEAIIEGLLPSVLEKPVTLHVVIGPMFEEKEKFHKAYDDCPNVILHENVKSMSDLMRNCDLAVSANGTTVYEGNAEFRQKVKGIGVAKARVFVSWQCCDDHICMPPMEKEIIIELNKDY